MEPEVLAGGIANAGAVVRVGDAVLRPATAATPDIHALLRALHDAGFDGVPSPIALEPDGRERLTYLPGDVPQPPYPAWAQEDAALASVAALLRRFHDAQSGLPAPADAAWSTELADPAPGPDAVLCHDDVCLENVVFRHGRAVALIDLDFVAPGRRTWDLASLARMCVPMDRPESAARLGWRQRDAPARLRLIADAYGLSASARPELLDLLGVQIDQGGRFVAARAAAGEAAFVALWEQLGGQERFDRRKDWFAAGRERFAAALA